MYSTRVAVSITFFFKVSSLSKYFLIELNDFTHIHAICYTYITRVLNFFTIIITTKLYIHVGFHGILLYNRSSKNTSTARVGVSKFNKYTFQWISDDISIEKCTNKKKK